MILRKTIIEADIDCIYIIQVLESVLSSNGLGDFAADKLEDNFRLALAEHRQYMKEQDEKDDCKRFCLEPYRVG